MRLENAFHVQVPEHRVWTYFRDLDRVAPCVPGAMDFKQVGDQEWTGKVRVKLGPMSLLFAGRLTRDEVDEEARRLVLTGRGRDQRGKGAANATVTVTVRGNGEATNVAVVQDLTVTGSIAQFGRGVMQDVSGRLVAEFARCLQRTIQAEHVEASRATTLQASGQDDTSPPVTARVPRAGELLLAAILGGVGRLIRRVRSSFGRGRHRGGAR